MRGYLPKGKNVPWSTGNEGLAQQIQDLTNRKARKILGYRPPDEVEKEWGQPSGNNREVMSIEACRTRMRIMPSSMGR